MTFDPTAVECQQLVLDVPEGTRVRLARKEIGRRSQLWRMTSTGMLQHEGSSPPHDPTSKKPQKHSNYLVSFYITGTLVLYQINHSSFIGCCAIIVFFFFPFYFFMYFLLQNVTDRPLSCKLPY